MECEICSSLPEHVQAYLDRDEELPPAAARLLEVGKAFRRCPGCGAWFACDYWPPGPGNIGDRDDLDRFDAEEAALIGPLLEALPGRAGVPHEVTDPDALTDSLLEPDADTSRFGEGLVHALSSRSEGVRNKAKAVFAMVAERIPPTDQARFLGGLLGRGEGQLEPSRPAEPCEVRRFALQGLVALAREQADLSEVEGTLIEHLTHGDAALRHAAASVLAFHLVSRGAWQRLEGWLGHDDATVRDALLWAIGQARKTEALMSPRLLPGMAEGLALLLPTLVARMVDADAEVRQSAARAVEDMMDHRLDVSLALPALVAALWDDSLPARRNAARILERASHAKLDFSPFILRLTQALSHPDEEVRANVTRAFSKLAFRARP